MPITEIVATYTNGVFRLLNPDYADLADGQIVKLTVEPLDNATYILGLAQKVFEGLTEEEIVEIEKAIRGNRSSYNKDAQEQPQDQIA